MTDEKLREEVERLILDNIYVGDKRLLDLMPSQSGHLAIIGLCKDCKHMCHPMKGVADGSVIEVTPPFCSRWGGFVKDDGWCYRFEARDGE